MRKGACEGRRRKTVGRKIIAAAVLHCGENGRTALAALVQGRVIASSSPSQRIAWARLSPHIAPSGCSDRHTAGRSGRPKIRQRKSASNCTQCSPAGLPPTMPGIGLEIDGAMQHAAQPSRHFIVATPRAAPSTRPARRLARRSAR